MHLKSASLSVEHITRGTLLPTSCQWITKSDQHYITWNNVFFPVIYTITLIVDEVARRQGTQTHVGSYIIEDLMTISEKVNDIIGGLSPSHSKILTYSRISLLLH
jgi:hypothetical protein